MPNLEIVTLPAPELDTTLTPSKWAQEYAAFQRLLPQLLASHRERYVAIHNGEVIATGADKLSTAMEALRQIGNISIHVGLVAEQSEPVVRSGTRREFR